MNIGDIERRGNYDIMIESRVIAVFDNVVVKRIVWTGTVHIQAMFGRQGGWSKRSKIWWEIWVDEEYHNKYSTRRLAMNRAKKLAL